VKLYVDDVRTPPAGWRLARTVAEAQALLERETVEEVSLDYYIGDGEGGTFLPVAETIAALPEDRRATAAAEGRSAATRRARSC
jgi:response regulator of citrate/malate metabolism